MTTKKGGRPVGRMLHAEAFEAIVAAKGKLKKDIAEDLGVSAGYLADLMAHRCCAAADMAEAIASALGVKTVALFPELAGWVGPLVDRDAKRRAVA